MVRNISNANVNGGGGEGGGGPVAANAVGSNNGYSSVDAELDALTGRIGGFTPMRLIAADAGGLLASGSNIEADLVSTSDNTTFTGNLSIRDAPFLLTSSNGGAPLELFSVDASSLAGEVHIRPTGIVTSGLSVTPTQVILRDNTMISSGKDVFLQGTGVQGGLAFSINALNSAPSWVNFDSLGAGDNTVFTQSDPVSDNDPTHVSSATLPAGGNNSNQNGNEFDCAASRETRVNANGDLVHRVSLRGRVFKLGGANVATPLFTLPEGYRPTRTVNFLSRQDTGSALTIMTILATGVCTMHAGSICTIDVSFWTN